MHRAVAQEATGDGEMNEATKQCPTCGKLMIEHERETTLLTSGDQNTVYEWWCGCGWTEWSRSEQSPYLNSKAALRERWQQVNKQGGTIGG